MTGELLLGLIVYGFVQAATPGPNNVMVMASAANYGIVRTLPHMAGIAAGLVVMLVLIGAGLAHVFDMYPVLPKVLTVASAVYLLYLAYKIGTAAAPGEGGSGTPLTALQAALFQWVNPKAWAMSIGAITLYAPDRSLGSAFVVAGVMGLVSLPSIAIWMVAGTQLARVLRGRALVMFNWTMAALLIASLIPALIL